MLALTHRRFIPELRRSLRGCRLAPSLKLCLFDDGYCLNLFGYLIPLLFLDRWAREPHEIMEAWGVYYSERSIVVCWGDKSKFIYMPWMYEQVRHEVLRPDGSWVPYVGSWEEGPLRVVNDRGATFGGKEPDGRAIEIYPYKYMLRSGEIQERTATVYVERREHRWRWLTKLPWPRRRYQSIQVEFSDEVGERTGSWKGGVVGTGHAMKPGETARDTLRRMEKERVFS